MLSLFHVTSIFLGLFLLFSVGTSDEAAAASTASLPTLVSAVSSSPSPSPVIGILTQKVWHDNKTASSYVAASYVKWIESGGARSIPIPYDASNATIDDLLTQIDGILLPGGSDAKISVGTHHLWNVVVNSYSNHNNMGEALIPIWGTCLGFEYLIQLGSASTATATPSILEDDFLAENISLPLYQVQQHQLYQNTAIYQSVQAYNLTMNNHHQGITPQRFRDDPGLTQLWTITSTNYDTSSQHKPFVSTIEPHHPDTFPVYGVQFHPEKNGFEYATYPHTNIPYESINHSKEGIALSMYMASFFVQDVVATFRDRGKTNTNANTTTTSKYTKPDTYPLVYSYPMERNYPFEQIYIIPASSSLSSSHRNSDSSTYE